MAANVATTLELGLREAAETVWARKVLLEVLGPAAPFTVIVGATHAHGKSVGRVEGTALALVLVRGAADPGLDLVDDAPEHAIARLVAIGAESGELVQATLAEVGETVWARSRLELEGHHGAIAVALGAIPSEVSWSAASTAAALRPLYPNDPRGPQ